MLVIRSCGGGVGSEHVVPGLFGEIRGKNCLFLSVQCGKIKATLRWKS